MRDKTFRRHHDQRMKDRAEDLVLNTFREDPIDPTTKAMAVKRADHLSAPAKVAKEKLPFDKKPLAVRAEITENEFLREL
ncbi:hypothetical protein HN858_02955 [Candidatus Falkowbacteria bacterium]|jgi:hypothetical protein|nr:hypothetical protein [Candidatus Falkowbacteria bacterium]MBT5503393.1 hypothetical protein [Candidatus Falkowbacteria bacterium]MBT6574044.1 hypothetical protein [Candidatus Falkowbacteria bacterium]MBT7348613.1 hypothetical protein [Candidatus Falkowbacteria bacterium]MBT7500404.1 hypothetical protein [Candidatus Falkowbacteria bacterium]